MDRPSDDVLRGLASFYGLLRAEHGAVFEGPPLVEPTGEFFPDDFELSQAGLDTLLARMRTYAPLPEELDLVVGLAAEAGAETEGGACGTGGCGTGGCAPGGPSASGAPDDGVLETEDGYALALPRATLGDPTLFAAALARGLGGVVLAQAELEVPPRERGAHAELVAVASGLGALVLAGSSVYAKGCGGLKEQRATHLSPVEAACAVALVCAVEELDLGRVRRHMPTTQREALEIASRWVGENPSLVAALRERPEEVAAGHVSVDERAGLFGRLFRRREAAPELAPRPRPARSEAELARLREAKALVDEALAEG